MGAVQSTIVLAAEEARGPPSRTTAACVAELVGRLLRGGRRPARPGAVGARDGQRAGAAQQVAGQVVVRHPDGDRALGVAEVPGQRRRVLDDQGQAARPERLGQRVAAGGSVDHQTVEGRRPPISTGTGMSRPRLLAASSPVTAAGVNASAPTP